jgi:DNA-binding transcriptional MerR regulator
MTATSQAACAPGADSVLDSAEAASEDFFAKSSDAFRTIGEAAAELGLKTHVLRFWETKFDNLRPMKRADGRRYYRPDDMEMLRRLQNLLHVQGLTIRGAIKSLDGEPGAASVSDASASEQLGGDDGAEEMIDPAETGASVRDLQAAVRSAVERGEFRTADMTESATAKARLESLLADLTNLKIRLDTVRAA